MCAAKSNLIESYFDRLWPLHRSISGEGLRKTYEILSELVPFNIIEVPSGNKVYDWVVPKEWKVNGAYLLGPDGSKILDVEENNLHLVNYSAPFKGYIDWRELQQHLHTKPELPNAIPYITSYYKEEWGFCLSENKKLSLPKEGKYFVSIDTELFDGSITLAEYVLEGDNEEELFFSSYACHPSLANDELSGPLVLAFLFNRLKNKKKRKFTYRFLLNPETIGSLAYLSLKNEELSKKMVAGYVLTNLAVEQPFRYKESKNVNSIGNKIASYNVNQLHGRVEKFQPLGSDERQYCSLGFNLPVGVLARGDNYYKEYHSSLDNKSFISFDAMNESIGVAEKICDVFEKNRILKNEYIFGEPNLGKRGLYPEMGRASNPDEDISAILWLLNNADGDKDLIDIAIESGIDFDILSKVAASAERKGVLIT